MENLKRLILRFKQTNQMIKLYIKKVQLMLLCFLCFTYCAIAQSESYFLYKIKPGETVEKIARKNNTTVAKIERLNNITPKTVLHVGKSLKIPMPESVAKNNFSADNSPKNIKPITTSQPITEPEPVATNPNMHVIKEGETLSTIAKANNTTVGNIMRLNGMHGKSVLKVGESIKLPGAETKPTETVKVTPTAVTPITTMPAKQAATPPASSVTKPTITKPENSISGTHVITEGETLSTIAQANKTTVGDIMRLNGMNSTSVLKVGEAIKIPNGIVNQPIVNTPIIDETLGIPTKPTSVTKPTNITPQPTTSPSQSVVQVVSPTKYTVAKGDNLYRISKTFKATEAQLMQWNGMKNDMVKPGQVLIVGQEVSSQPTPILSKDTVVAIKPVPSIPKKKVVPHFATRDTTHVASAKDSTNVSKRDSTYVAKSLSISELKDSTAAKVPEPKENNTINLDPQPIPKYAKYTAEEGFYAGYFNRKNISKNTSSGDAAAFKSNSGWSDKKYYLLINDINQGTIVRITYNDKSICAKVMGPLPNIKEDMGLLLRINTAAADALGVQEAKFFVTVNY